jgi:hypothetical protein
MSFFEPPPPREIPDPEEFDEPEWFGPPRHELGAAIPLRIVLARTDQLAIAIVEATAYTNGFELKLVRRLRKQSYEEFEDFDFHHPVMWKRRQELLEKGQLPPELFRFGVEFSDGSKATTLAGHPFEAGLDEKPEGPVLMERGGGGGGGNWDERYWVWPLPPDGPLAFVCEWPAKGVPLTRREFDAGLIREAAAQVDVLWPDEGGPRLDSGGGHIFMVGGSVPDNAVASNDDAEDKGD